MADLKINDYTAASAIENTTSFIAQTVSNTTQRVPLSVIKSNIANEFMKNAELVYDNYGGAYPSGNSDIGVAYDISGGDLLIILTNAEYEHSVIYNFYSHKTVFASPIEFLGDGNEVIKVSIYNRDTSSYEDKTITCFGDELTTTVGLVIYKIYKIKLGA